MKEKSSSLSAGQASDGCGPSGPSVDSSSELERSTLELRLSLGLSCCSTDVDSVYEDKWLLGGCFPADVALLSGDDGDSGPKLQGKAEGDSFHRGAHNCLSQTWEWWTCGSQCSDSGYSKGLPPGNSSQESVVHGTSVQVAKERQDQNQG